MTVDPVKECQNIHNVVVLPDERISNLQQYQPTSNIPDFETHNLIKDEICLTSGPNLFDQSRTEKDKVNNYPPCTLDADIEKGTTEIPNSNKESVGNLKSDYPLARIMPTEICLQIGGKFMQFLVNHGPELPKFTSRDKFLTERVHYTSSNRARKYKRSASFNSRRVLLLFSVLSSMGTIILIYLTLRVRQIGDWSVSLYAILSSNRSHQWRFYYGCSVSMTSVNHSCQRILWLDSTP